MKTGDTGVVNVTVLVQMDTGSLKLGGLENHDVGLLPHLTAPHHPAQALIPEISGPRVTVMLQQRRQFLN